MAPISPPWRLRISRLPARRPRGRPSVTAGREGGSWGRAEAAGSGRRLRRLLPPAPVPPAARRGAGNLSGRVPPPPQLQLGSGSAAGAGARRCEEPGRRLVSGPGSAPRAPAPPGAAAPPGRDGPRPLGSQLPRRSLCPGWCPFQRDPGRVRTAQTQARVECVKV